MTLFWYKPHCFSYVNRNWLALQHDLHKNSNEVCIKARSTPASLLFKGLLTEDRTVKWSIDTTELFELRTSGQVGIRFPNQLKNSDIFYNFKKIIVSSTKQHILSSCFLFLRPVSSLITQTSKGSLNKMVKRNLFWTLFTKYKSRSSEGVNSENTYPTVRSGYD